MPSLSDVAMRHFLEPKHTGALPSPDAEGWAGSKASSRFMCIQLQVRDGLIIAARFATYGCAPAIAAGDFLCHQVEGVSPQEARDWKPDILLHALGGLPESRRYCANLAVEALHAALDKWEVRQ